MNAKFSVPFDSFSTCGGITNLGPSIVPSHSYDIWKESFQTVRVTLTEIFFDNFHLRISVRVIGWKFASIVAGGRTRSA